MEKLNDTPNLETGSQMATLGKEKLGSFIQGLLNNYQVYGPTANRSEYSFTKIETEKDLALDYRTTILPPKKYFHQPYQSLFSFKQGEIIEEDTAEEEFVLFGIHPCDVNALRILDTVFKSEYEDIHYLSRREEGIIIAFNCTEVDEECFCLSRDTGPELEEGYDLLLTDIGNKYVVEVGSKRGEQLLEQCSLSPLLTEITTQDIKLQAARLEAARYKLEGRLEVSDQEEISRLLAQNYEHPIWEELKEECMACGSCTMVCPTCFCFTITDQIDLNLEEGKRQRVWDSCMLLDFSEVALGVNFREDRAARIKQRIYHKLYTMEEQFDVLGCVGCGRCLKTCVKDIDLTDIIDRIKEGEQNEG